MPQAMPKLLAVVGRFDDIAGEGVYFFGGHAGAGVLDNGRLCLIYQIINTPKCSRRIAAEVEGAGQVAVIAVHFGAHIDQNDVTDLEMAVSRRGVMGQGTVGAKPYDDGEGDDSGAVWLLAADVQSKRNDDLFDSGRRRRSNSDDSLINGLLRTREIGGLLQGRKLNSPLDDSKLGSPLKDNGLNSPLR